MTSPTTTASHEPIALNATSCDQGNVSNVDSGTDIWVLVPNCFQHAASGRKGVFAAKYDQYAERNGQTFTLLGVVDPNSYDSEDCGEMFHIRFADGIEVQAWPEEVESAVIGNVMKSGMTTNEFYSTLPAAERPVFDQSVGGFVIHAHPEIGVYPRSYEHSLHAFARSKGVALVDDEHVPPKGKGNVQEDAKEAAKHELQQALKKATECGFLDDLAGVLHPDAINQFCDAVGAFDEPEKALDESPSPGM